MFLLNVSDISLQFFNDSVYSVFGVMDTEDFYNKTKLSLCKKFVSTIERNVSKTITKFY